MFLDPEQNNGEFLISNLEIFSVFWGSLKIVDWGKLQKLGWFAALRNFRFCA